MARKVVGHTTCGVGWRLSRSLVDVFYYRKDLRNRKLNCLSQAYASTTASGKRESKENLWKHYFEDPSQWVDCRMKKKFPSAPDFKHRITGEALRIANSSTPQWAKTMFREGFPDEGDHRGRLEAEGLKGLTESNRYRSVDEYQRRIMFGRIN